MSSAPGLPDPGAPDRPVDRGVELLERAIAYTHGTLCTVRPGELCLPTPCELWRLGDLLAHMEDALDAFAEGATGAIGLHATAPTPLEERLTALQAKACGLLGAWVQATGDTVLVEGRPVPVAAVSRMAALEVAVHGWDVGRTTGRGDPLPDGLAEELLPVAMATAGTTDDPPRFAPPVPVPPDAPPSARLLGLLGRVPDWRARS